MTTNAVNLAKLLGPSATVPAESLSSDISFGPEEYASAASLPGTASVGDQVFVTETNRLYIWTGQGWYNIALINQTPTWDSGGQPDGSYVLATDGSPTTITLLATDPDGLPVSYTATADSAFDTIATVSDSDNVFTITPKFTIDDDSATDGNGSITFRATDGVNYASALSSFTISFATGVENSRYTTALVTSVGANGGTNSTVTDASTNNHTLTVNGTPSSQTFSLYRSGGYSYYFDGTGDYITTTDNLTDFHVGTGDFTVEAWIWKSANGQNGYDGVCALGADGNAYDGFFLEASGTRGIKFYWAGASTPLSSAATPNTSTWIHIAVARSSGVTKLFRDGVEVDSTSASYSMPTSASVFTVGKYGGNIAYTFNGYIRDFRFVKGTAVYTSDFTPPTEPLEAITNTTLLTCHLPYIKDGSTSDHSMVVTGNVSAKPFAPYDYLEYDSAIHRGSIAFDGPSTGNITFNQITTSSTFTIEWWCYPNQVSQTYQNFVRNTSPAIQVLLNGSTFIWWEYSFSHQTAVTANQWHHMAVVGDGTNIYLYLDGVKSTSSIAATAFSLDSITRSDAENFDGYMSDIRLIDGTALYTSDFTPPTEPLTAISGTELLISGTDASIIDKSQSTQLTLVGNTQSSTTVTKYGSSSIYLPGSGNSLTFNGGIATGDFTVECWWNPVSMTSVGGVFASASTSDYGMVVAKDQWWIGTNSSVTQIVSTTGIDQSGWHHIAIVRSGSTIVGYVNGSSVGTVNISADISLNFAFATRYNDTYTTYPSTGYIEDFRLTKGLARYTANFTPPTASLEG